VVEVVELEVVVDVELVVEPVVELVVDVEDFDGPAVPK